MRKGKRRALASQQNVEGRDGGSRNLDLIFRVAGFPVLEELLHGQPEPRYVSLNTNKYDALLITLSRAFQCTVYIFTLHECMKQLWATCTALGTMISCI